MRSKRFRTNRSRRLVAAIEPLERRLQLNCDGPFIFEWIGESGNWNDASHWMITNPPPPQDPPCPPLPQLPRGTDTVIINTTGTVTIPQFSSAGCKTATISADLHIADGATFFLNGNLALNGTMTLADVTGGAATMVNVLSTATIGGSGTIRFQQGGGIIGSGATLNTLTLGSGLTIRNGTSHGTLTCGSIVSHATVISEGSGSNGISFAWNKTFTNRGTIDLNSGTIRMSASGANATWSNQGQININGGQFITAGVFRQSDFGNYTRSGGAVHLQGTLQGNLALNAQTGSWFGGGTLAGGRLTTRDGAQFMPSAIAGTTFENYTIGSDLTWSTTLGVRDALTLDGTTLTLRDATVNFFNPTNAIAGNGQIIADSTGISGGATFSMFTGGPQTLTVDSGVAVRTNTGHVTFQSGSSSSRLIVRGSIAGTNTKAISLNVGITDLHGQIAVASGSHMNVHQTLNVLSTGSVLVGATGQIILNNRSINNHATTSGRGRSAGTMQVSGGTSAAPVTLEAAGEDRGPLASGFNENFAVGVLRLNGASFLRLVDAADNSPNTTDEVLYLDSLVIANNATLDLAGRKLYVRQIEQVGTGAIIGGTPTILPDGGPILYASPTSGRIAAVGEQDNWTFFGRAGQTVSAVLNASLLQTAGSPAAINPALSIGRLSLRSPNGTELGSIEGGAVTLPQVTLPADGTYTLRVQAPLNNPSRTGIYNLTLYDIGADTRPLVLNTITAGNIEAPFTRDRWTFSLEAGQQVQFDLIAAQTTGLQFTLDGPDGFVAFENLTDDSTLITIPGGRGGNYVLTAKGQTDQTGAYSFIVRDGSITQLALGAPFAGTLPGSGAPRWFRVTLPNPGQLLVKLDDSNNADRNQLYLRHGQLPTRQEFDHRFHGFAADAEIYVPNAVAGEWFVLVYGDHVPQPSTYTLQAEFSDLRITSLTPDRYGIGNTMTMTLFGGGFEPGTTVELVGGTTTLTATSVEIDSFTQVTATFNLTGAPQRAWDVRVENDPLTFTLPNAFRTLADAPAELETRLIMPAAGTRTSVSTLTLEYANIGNVAMPAPLLIVQSADPQLDQHPILSLDLEQTIEDFFATVVRPGVSERVMVLGSGAVPGMLGPGERMSIPFNYLGEKPPFETTDTFLELEVKCVHEGDEHMEGVSIPWADLKEGLQPPTVPDAIWDIVFADITNPIPMVQDYAAMLVANAQYLGRLGLRVLDIDDLWNFQVRKALGTFTAIPLLASAVDAQVPQPEAPLALGRYFPDGVLARNVLGPFGYGWDTPWTATLDAGPNGDVITIAAGAGARTFVRDGRGSTPITPSSTYFSTAGDSSKLKRVGSGIFELRETDGTVTRFRADGKIDFIQDAKGNRITAGYDGGGRLMTLSHSAGGEINIGYNGAGRITLVTDSLGHSMTYTYDAANEHLLSATADDGTAYGYTYDTGGNALRRHALLSVAAGGTTRSYGYDAQGRLASTSLPGNVMPVTMSYASGRVTLTDAVGSTQVFYDHRGNVAKVTDPLGISTSARYDRHNRLIQRTTGDGASTHYQWCTCGALEGAIDELGNTTLYSRAGSAFKQVTALTDPKGNITRFTYDPAGNALATLYPDGTIEQLGNYTPAGLPQLYTNRRGQSTTITYNAAGQVTRRTRPDTTFIDYAYDARGRIQTITDGADVTTFTYDTAVDGDRLKRVTYPGGRFVEYDYDEFGRRTAVRDHTGYTTRYEFDGAGRLQRVRDGGGAILATYSYDAAGRGSRVDHGNGTFTTWSYDAAGRVTAIDNFRSAGTLNSFFHYTYDARGRRLTQTSGDGTWTYGYDPAGRLTSASFASASSIPDQDIEITYDANGNRTFTTINGTLIDYGTNELDQYATVDGVAHQYDADGNLVFDGTTTFAYDELNRLIGIDDGTNVTQFAYNGLGDRAATIVNGTRTEYLHDPQRLSHALVEFDGAGTITARNIFAGSLLARTDGAAGAPNYLDSDAVGSAVGISDLTGAYVNRYAYDPFGTVLARNETLDNPFEFIGRFGVTEQQGGFSNMSARLYSAELSRFTAIDPLRFIADTNLYQYAFNSPTNFIDPSGLLPGFKPVGRLTGIPDDVINFGGGLGANVGVAAFEDDPLSSLALGTIPLPGIDNAIGVMLDHGKEIGEGLCGLDRQAALGTINKGAAAQLLQIDKSLAGKASRIQDGCLDAPGSPDDDMGVGDPCASGQTDLTLRSLDPNDKIPPRGSGADNRVLIEDPIAYTVDFENLGPGSVDENGDPYPVVASVPAQRVAIADQLSANLDWSTVRFSEFSFGETIVPAPDGFGSFHASVPAEQNGVEFIVQIDAEIDLASGVLTVIFQAIDPITGLPPDPFIGVVPPEDGSGNGMGYFKFSAKAVSTVADGTAIRNIALIRFDANEIIATNQVDPLDPAQGTDPAREALVTIDALPPSVIGGPTFEFDTPTPRVTIQFSEDVESSLAIADLLVENLTTSTMLEPSLLAYDATTHTATFHLPTALPDGNYAVTLPGANVTDGVGRPMSADATGDFFFLRGDANRDRRVNLQDFNILAANFGQTPRTFSQGDFTYDGVVNLQDFNALASRFGSQLPPPTTRQAPTAGGGRAQLLALRGDILAGRTSLPARFSRQIITELDALLAGAGGTGGGRGGGAPS